MKKTLPLMILSLVLSGCASASMQSDGTAEAALRETLPRFLAAFNAGDAEAVARFYADEAIVLAPNADTAVGRAAIAQAFGTFFPMKPKMELMQDRVVQSCNEAWEYGRYTMDLTPPGGSMMTDRGKYLTIWRKMPNGEWKIVADMFNTSLPAPHM